MDISGQIDGGGGTSANRGCLRFSHAARAACFLVLAAAAHAQSLAEPVNHSLPVWLRIGGEFRARWEGALPRGFTPGQDDEYLLTRVRINLELRPLSWMKFVFQGQDVRIVFNQSVPGALPYRNPMDLRIGYLVLGDPARNPVSLRAGRQDFSYGDNRVVGPTNWSNAARSFDAVRVTLRHKTDWLDIFASSVVVLTSTEFDRPQAGNNLHGMYGHTEKLVPDAVVEGYLLWRIAPGATDFKTLGVRWVGHAGAIDYRTEMADQIGGIGPNKVRAWAGHWMVGYTIPSVKWKPRFSAEYNHATGDRDTRDNRRETFDQLYPTAHGKYGLADQVGWRNINDVRAGFDIKPMAKITAATNFHDWWLASAHDALYAANSSVVAVKPDGSAGRHVGHEIDLEGTYALTKQTQFGAGIGHIFPGEFLKRTTKATGYTYPYLMLNYTF